MTLAEYSNILHSIPLFKDMSDEYILKFFRDTEYKIITYANEDIIFIEDELCTNLSIILSGSIEIQKIDSSGKILTIAKFLAGDTFGENLIFGDKNTYPMTVVSKEKTSVLHIPKDSIMILCQTNTTFLSQFLRSLSNKAMTLSSKLKEIPLKTIRQKICEFIFWEYNSTKSVNIKLNMSKKDWADKIGVQRPSLSRELIKMKEEGLIDYDKNSITILSIESIKHYIR